MMAMLRMNAILRLPADAGSSIPAIAGGSTWLPRPTNSRIAAIVAQVVMTWLPASRTALLLGCCTGFPSRWSSTRRFLQTYVKITLPPRRILDGAAILSRTFLHRRPVALASLVELAAQPLALAALLAFELAPLLVERRRLRPQLLQRVAMLALGRRQRLFRPLHRRRARPPPPLLLPPLPIAGRAGSGPACFFLFG